MSVSVQAKRIGPSHFWQLGSLARGVGGAAVRSIKGTRHLTNRCVQRLHQLIIAFEVRSPTGSANGGLTWPSWRRCPAAVRNRERILEGAKRKSGPGAGIPSGATNPLGGFLPAAAIMRWKPEARNLRIAADARSQAKAPAVVAGAPGKMCFRRPTKKKHCH